MTYPPFLRLLRQLPQNLEEKDKILTVHREHFEVKKWTKQVSLDCLEKGSNTNIFQYCLDSNGYNQYMRAIQGHSEGNKVDPSQQDNCGIPLLLD